MFWIIQRDFYSQPNFDKLVQTLERNGIEHIETRVNEIETLTIPKDIPVMVCGGESIAMVAVKNNWIPGSFLNYNFNYITWSTQYGDDLLNNKYIQGNISEINTSYDKFFMRPLGDTKTINGKVYSKYELDLIKNDVISLIRGDIQVIVSPVKTIYAEYRFFVVDNIIVASSQYKSGGNLFTSELVAASAASFVSDMITKWQPARAFVIDVAFTDKGYKIVEFNNINGSGFYACNIGKIVEALENMKF
jgi:hypothetical protein